jgi:N-acetyl-alpha-D-muramate 1-phosphate uridylyltransferase
MKAMILAAGLGTRLKPFTENNPKALLPINGKSLLQRNVEYLTQYGFDNIIVNVHHFAPKIIDAIQTSKGWGATVSISDETNEVLETGGGLKMASHFFTDSSEPFLLMNADILTTLNLADLLAAHNNNIDALCTIAVTKRESSRNLLFDNGKLCGWRNNNTGEQKGSAGEAFAFSGIHIISPKIFPLITETGKFSMIDLYVRLATSGQNIYAFEHSRDAILDVGKPEAIAIAESLFN